MISHDVTSEVVKASPAIAIGSLTILGYGVDVWATILTAIYVVLQMYFLLRDKWWRERKGKNDNKE